MPHHVGQRARGCLGRKRKADRLDYLLYTARRREPILVALTVKMTAAAIGNGFL
jgi:hypothetical protein